MRLLAIDTSAEACSVGVAVDEGRPVLISQEAGRAHAERLMPMIAAAMADAGLVFADIDRVAVTVGPGSFTGVRIGIAAARGLALVTGAEVIGIGSLAVHAAEAAAVAGGVPVTVAIAAGRGDIYAQRFGSGGLPQSEPALGPPEMFAGLPADPGVLCGSGADLLNAAAGRRDLIVHRQAAPSIGHLLRMARAAPSQSEAPRPLYLRPPDARPQAHARIARR